MTGRLPWPIVWRRLFPAQLPRATRGRRDHPGTDVSGAAGEEARAARLLAAVAPLCLWRP